MNVIPSSGRFFQFANRANCVLKSFRMNIILIFNILNQKIIDFDLTKSIFVNNFEPFLKTFFFLVCIFSKARLKIC